MTDDDALSKIVAAFKRIGKGLMHTPLGGKVGGSYSSLVPHIDSLGRNVVSLVASHYKLTLRLEKEKENLNAEVKSLTEKVEALEDEIKSHEELRRDFIVNMNHKLRTPLTSIVGFTSLLENNKEKINPQDREKYLSIISKETARLLGLVDTLLDLTRLSSGEITLSPKPIMINKYITAQIGNWKEGATIAGVDIVFRPDDSLGEIVADPRLLMKMFDCLLGNSMKHTSDGEQVIISTKKEGNNALIFIEDEGEGIPPEKLELVFQNFTQNDGLLSPDSLGLKLSLARSVVWLHMGTINIKSKEGAGTRFEVSLPINAMEESRIEQELMKERARILVVDDDESSRELVVELLKNYADVSVASNGQEAIMVCEQLKPHLVLMDLLMPVMDGFAAIEKIRKIRKIKNTPVVAVSALIDKEEVIRAYNIGADNFISKPYQREEVIEVITSQLPDMIDFE